MAVQMYSSETTAQHRCRNCGSFVTRRFASVFGDNDDVVYGCPNCLRSVDLHQGGATAP